MIYMNHTTLLQNIELFIIMLIICDENESSTDHEMVNDSLILPHLTLAPSIIANNNLDN